MTKKDKIISITLFSILTCILVFLTFFQSKKNNVEVFSKVEVEGNLMLTERDYLLMTGLDNVAISRQLSLRLIKEKFENHPYVESVKLELNADKSVTVQVNEKKIFALLNFNGMNYLVTNSYEILNIENNSLMIDYPVITNSTLKEIKINQSVKSEELKIAKKIVYTSKNISRDFAKNLAEINLRNGNEIVVYLSGLKPVILFGKNDEVKKIYALYELLKSTENYTSMIKTSDYIDLRYSESLFIGNNQLTGI